MQLRGKEDLRLMRSVTLTECCPESNHSSAFRNEGKSSSDEDINAPNVQYKTQIWNETHYRLFGHRSCAFSHEKHSESISVEYSVEHYQFSVNNNQKVTSSAICSRERDAYTKSPHARYHEKERCCHPRIRDQPCSRSNTLPAFGVERILGQHRRQNSNISLPNSSGFHAVNTSTNKLPQNFPFTALQNRRNTNPECSYSMLSSIHKYRTFDHINLPFPESSLQNDSFSDEFDQSHNLCVPVNSSMHLSKQSLAVFNDQNNSNEIREDREPYRVEESSADQLLTAATNSQKHGIYGAFTRSKLAVILCLFTVIVFLALGSFVYISVTGAPAASNVTSTTTILQRPHADTRQADICGKRPKNFTVTRPNNDGSQVIFPPIENFLHRQGNIDYEGSYGMDQSLLSLNTMKSTETFTESEATAPLTITPIKTITAPQETTKQSVIKPEETATVNAVASYNRRKFATGDPILIRNRRVVGGKNAQLGAVPWQVSLWVQDWVEEKSIHRFYCGGSLVMSRWIITAAHCTEGHGNPNSWKAYVGLVALSRKSDPSVQERNVIYIYNHDNYTGSPWYNNDVSLFQVEKPFNYTKYIQPICLPPLGFELPPDAECYISGWGTTYNKKERIQYPDVLQRAKINIIERKTCNKWLNGQVKPQMICAGEPEGGKDTCTGDSGGPLSYYDPEKEIWILAGSVSWGDQRCGLPQDPGIYAKMSDFTTWLWNRMITFDDRE